MNRLHRLVLFTGAALAICLTACNKEREDNIIYTTADCEFSIIVDNCTESIQVVIEGGFNPDVTEVVSNADWLQARYLGTIELEEYKDPNTGFFWLSGGKYPLLELSYETYDYLGGYDERDTDVVITTGSGNKLTLHVTQGARNMESGEDKPDYCFISSDRGLLMVVNDGGGMGGPRLSDIKSVNTDFEADWTKEEAIYLFSGKGPEVVNGIKGYTIVPLPWAEINESRLPDGEAKKMLTNNQWRLVLNYTGNRSLPDFNYFAMYNPYVCKLRFFYYLSSDANMKDINDHLWAITIPTEWAAAMERSYSLPYDFTDHSKLSNYRNSRFTYLTTPFTDDGRFGSSGNIVPESGWWAFDLDLPVMHEIDQASLANKEISLRMLTFNKDQVSLHSVVKADIEGSFKGKMNLDALWKKPRSVSSVGTILSTITGLGSDLASDDNFSSYFLDLMDPAKLANPYALGLSIASIGLKGISGVITGLDEEETPDTSKTGEMEGTINLGMNGTIDTEGFIKGDRQAGLKFPTFTIGKLGPDAGIGEGLWNLETTPTAYFTKTLLWIEDEAIRKACFKPDEAGRAYGIDYFFDLATVRLKLNEKLFPKNKIKALRIQMTPGGFAGAYGESLTTRKLLGISQDTPIDIATPAFQERDWNKRTLDVHDRNYPLDPLPADEVPTVPGLNKLDDSYVLLEAGHTGNGYTLIGWGIKDTFVYLPFWSHYQTDGTIENSLPELSIIVTLEIQMEDGVRSTYTRTFPVRLEYVESLDDYNRLINTSISRLTEVPYADLLYSKDRTVEKLMQREIDLRGLWGF